MATDRIKIRKKNNPSVTRTIMAAALKTFEKRGWERTAEDSENTITPLVSAPLETKKKDVEPVADPGEDNSDVTNETGSDAFAKIEGEDSVDSLREEFLKLSGKSADKRWSEKRLNEEIAKLKTV